MYCPKCRSRLYPDDEKYMNAVGVCGYCVTWDISPHKIYRKAWAEHLEKVKAAGTAPRRKTR